LYLSAPKISGQNKIKVNSGSKMNILSKKSNFCSAQPKGKRQYSWFTPPTNPPYALREAVKTLQLSS